MAQIPCQSDDGNAAIFIGTNLDTGESVQLCPPCLVTFCATIIEGITGLPVAAILDNATGADDGTETPPDDETPTDTTTEDSTPDAATTDAEKEDSDSPTEH